MFKTIFSDIFPFELEFSIFLRTSFTSVCRAICDEDIEESCDNVASLFESTIFLVESITLENFVSIFLIKLSSDDCDNGSPPVLDVLLISAVIEEQKDFILSLICLERFSLFFGTSSDKSNCVLSNMLPFDSLIRGAILSAIFDDKIIFKSSIYSFLNSVSFKNSSLLYSLC